MVMTPFLILAFWENGIPTISWGNFVFLSSGMVAYHEVFKENPWDFFAQETENLVEEITIDEPIQRIKQFERNIFDFINNPSWWILGTLFFERVMHEHATRVLNNTFDVFATEINWICIESMKNE
jgi:hypothetical protein